MVPGVTQETTALQAHQTQVPQVQRVIQVPPVWDRPALPEWQAPQASQVIQALTENQASNRQLS
jgi:hypothetical protein